MKGGVSEECEGGRVRVGRGEGRECDSGEGVNREGVK